MATLLALSTFYHQTSSSIGEVVDGYTLRVFLCFYNTVMFSQHHQGMSLLMGPFRNLTSVIRLLLTVKLIDPKRRKEEVNKTF